jgi:hypothetical protein
VGKTRTHSGNKWWHKTITKIAKYQRGVSDLLDGLQAVKGSLSSGKRGLVVGTARFEVED